MLSEMFDRLTRHWTEPKTRVAVFGGGFNPPHFGHISIIAWILGTEQANHVLMVPCWRHIFGKRLAPFQDRLAMCDMVATIFSNCSVHAIEGNLKGRSVMLRTIRALKANPINNTNVEFSLVMGLDNWLIRDKWEGFDQLEKECQIIVVGRDDQPQLPDIRSTKIRSLLMAGKDISSLVSARVLSYIRTHGLYGCKSF